MSFYKNIEQLQWTNSKIITLTMLNTVFFAFIVITKHGQLFDVQFTASFVKCFNSSQHGITKLQVTVSTNNKMLSEQFTAF